MPPRTKTSITPLVGDVAAGDEVSFPPRDCQLDHVPVYDLWYRAPFAPCTKIARLFAFCADAAGPVPEASCPPMLFHEPPKLAGPPKLSKLVGG